ncbi:MULTISPECIES: signal peptidase I [Bacillota]|jgi:signal peptidase|uniref:Signal peptidase I n=2 Tax=Amedibacillus TaxID=2749846 RepID=A0A7G9GIS5_9FIRM|nr:MULTISPECIES: signal peptidase I [Bacillota]QNM10707.1 signal peptidase I [[Eubacterium] hominis]MCH4285672.1 signal peptidase I [Amedibacillus hominis]RGB53986.1 signal peptidase I [Absiella sp. AM22-9]RGB61255.1 signal peptidase I [Absiella sp. AM10-20]RGB63114.1 signal peptidase I [Absiella sp. AM09-45]
MIKKVWNIITTIVVILVILLACIFFVPRLFGITPMAVLSGSMEPTYHVGGLVFVQKVDPSDVEVGDSITFTIGNDTVVTHRVIEVNKEEQSFKTKGDANDNEDGGSVAFNNVKGRALGFTIPYLGFLAVYLNSTSGIIILVAFILIMMLLSFIVDQLSKDDKEKK